jgi:hypothetical protein
VNLGKDSEEDSPIGALLMDILSAFVHVERTRLFSRTLVEALNENQDRPWMQTKKGREITQLWLARQLAPYGVRPRIVRIENEAARGYAQEDFIELFRRYVPPSELERVRCQPPDGPPANLNQPEPNATIRLSVSVVFDGGLFNVIDAFPILLMQG